MLRVKRVYDDPTPDDGVRILVDRLWPRGMTKDAAHLDRWQRGLAPSNELRRWFGHDPARYVEFVRRFRAELAAHASELDELRGLAASQTVTLLHGARDREHNLAMVLRDVIEGGNQEA